VSDTTGDDSSNTAEKMIKINVYKNDLTPSLREGELREFQTK
jgi:hypothetical protein